MFNSRGARPSLHPLVKSLALAMCVSSVLAGCNAGGSLPSGSNASTSPSVVSATPTAAASATSSATPRASGAPTVAPSLVGATPTPRVSAAPHATSVATAVVTTAPTAVPTAQSFPNQNGSSNNSNGISSGSIANACYQTASPISTEIVIAANGNISGSSYTTNTGGTWSKYSFTQDLSTPEPIDTSTPDIPSSYINDNIYSGTYSIQGETPGCFYVIEHADGSAFSSEASYNAPSFGFVAWPDGYIPQIQGSGIITSLSIANLSTGSGSGAITLDNGQTGSISITNFATFQDPQYADEASYSVMKRVKTMQSRFHRN